MNPAQFWALEMQNQQNQQAQQQQNQENIMKGLMDLAGAYMEQENMKSSVKAGDNLLKVLGPGIGMTEETLKQMDYGKMPLREKYAFQQGILNNYAVAAQTRNFGQSLGVRQQGLQIQQNAPFVNAGIQGAKDRASGNQTFTGGGTAPSPADVASAEPPLPPFSPGAGAAPAPTPAASMPGGAQSKEALNRWRSSQGLPPIP